MAMNYTRIGQRLSVSELVMLGAQTQLGSWAGERKPGRSKPRNGFPLVFPLLKRADIELGICVGPSR